MTTILNVIRVFLLSILYVSLTLLITLSPIVISLSTTITDRQSIKQVLSNIGTYREITEIAFPTTDPLVEKYFSSLFNSSDMEGEVRKLTEQTIDQVYDQLEKERETISLSVDTSGIKQALILGYLKNYAIGKQTNTDTLTILKCSNELVAKYDKSCPPELREINKEIDNIFSNFTSDKELLNLNKDTYNYINTLRELPKYLITFMAISTVLIVLISSNKQKGIYIVSIISIVISLFNLGSIYVLKNNTGIISNFINIFTSNTQTSVDDILNRFFLEYILLILNNSLSIIYGIIIIYSFFILLNIAFTLSKRLIKKE